MRFVNFRSVQKQGVVETEDHFTPEPRAVTMKMWEPKRKWPEAVPTHLQNHEVWSRTLKCNVKSYVTSPSTKCYFNEFLFTHVFINKINQSLWALERHGLPVLCQAYLQEVVFENNLCDHETWSIWCHVGMHVDFTSIILHSHTPFVPWA
jgi:hypothetical protein